MPTKKRKSSPLHTMPCGCQYERLNWINRPQPCRGKLYLDTHSNSMRIKRRQANAQAPPTLNSSPPMTT